MPSEADKEKFMEAVRDAGHEVLRDRVFVDGESLTVLVQDPTAPAGARRVHAVGGEVVTGRVRFYPAKL